MWCFLLTRTFAAFSLRTALRGGSDIPFGDGLGRVGCVGTRRVVCWGCCHDITTQSKSCCLLVFAKALRDTTLSSLSLSLCFVPQPSPPLVTLTDYLLHRIVPPAHTHSRLCKETVSPIPLTEDAALMCMHGRVLPAGSDPLLHHFGMLRPQHLHADLQDEARNLRARADRAQAADSRLGASEDPLVTCLLGAAEAWMDRSRPEDEGDDGSHFRVGSARPGADGIPTASRRRTNSRSRRATTAGARGKAVNKGRRGLSMTGIGGSRRSQELKRDRRELAKPKGEPGGELAAATATSPRRRELFYSLVDAFRDYKARASQVSGVAAVDVSARTTDGELAKETKCILGAGLTESGEGGGDGLLPTTAVPVDGGGGGGGYCMGSLASDRSSASVRTLCVFGPPERCSVSTQTIAKVGGGARWIQNILAPKDAGDGY